MERYPEIYDGAAPSLGGGAMDILFETHSLYEDNRPLLQSKTAALDDVFRVGGLGAVADVLKSKAQQHALDAVLKAGFPPQQSPVYAAFFGDDQPPRLHSLSGRSRIFRRCCEAL